MNNILSLGWCTLCYTILIVTVASGQNLIPVFNHVSVRIDSSHKILTVNYDLTDDDSTVDVRFQLKTKEGINHPVNLALLTGDVGAGVRPGRDKRICWRYADSPLPVAMLTLKLVADDHRQVDIRELVSQVDEHRLRDRLKMVVGLRNPISEKGKRQLVLTKNLIDKVFVKAGYQTQRQSFEFGGYQGQNVIGRKTGTAPQPRSYLVGACFDTYDVSPGANSNGSGLVGMLEIADVLSKYSAKNSLIFAGFDYSLEEYVGCNQFLFHGGLQRHEQIEGAFDLDKIGRYDDKPYSYPKEFPVTEANRLFMEKNQYRGNFVRVVTDQRSRVLAERFKTHAAQYAPGLPVMIEEFTGYGEFADGQNFFFQQSDHIPFWYRRRKALWINDGKSGDRDDDTGSDIESKINYTYLKKIVQITLATTAELAGIEHAGTYEVPLTNFPLTSLRVKPTHP